MFGQDWVIVFRCFLLQLPPFFNCSWFWFAVVCAFDLKWVIHVLVASFWDLSCNSMTVTLCKWGLYMIARASYLNLETCTAVALLWCFGILLLLNLLVSQNSVAKSPTRTKVCLIYDEVLWMTVWKLMRGNYWFASWCVLKKSGKSAMGMWGPCSPGSMGCHGACTAWEQLTRCGMAKV